MSNAGHWKFGILDGELMTVGTTDWNFSRLSAAALKDLGYVVDLTRAGDFKLQDALINGVLPPRC